VPRVSPARSISRSLIPIRRAWWRPAMAIWKRSALIHASPASAIRHLEGHALEDLAGQLYEERSRRGIGDFPLTERIRGYWDRGDVDIDLVAVSDEQQRLRFGTCKRSADKLPGSIDALLRGAQRFLAAHGRFERWRIEYVAIAPHIEPELQQELVARNVRPQSLSDLVRGL
jgi:hypothetical protein